jgi:hypothetical protein
LDAQFIDYLSLFEVLQMDFGAEENLGRNKGQMSHLTCGGLRLRETRSRPLLFEDPRFDVRFRVQELSLAPDGADRPTELGCLRVQIILYLLLHGEVHCTGYVENILSKS